jgi:lipopolysaccharide/colanic/teichoic acid biosynthesis glycosyltransferase
MDLDRQYVEAAGMGLDVRILLRTLPAVIQRKGAY